MHRVSSPLRYLVLKLDSRKDSFIGAIFVWRDGCNVEHK